MLNYYLLVAVICIVARYTHAGYSTPVSCEEPNTDNNLCKNNCTDQCPTVPATFCTRECGQGCFCKQDYSRAPNGTCIPTETCPVDCSDEDEVFGKRCDDTCYEDIVRCASTQYGCFCKPGLKRIGGVCAPEANCFNCGENEVYGECTNSCFDQCPGPEPTVCPLFCAAGCACKDNYKRDPATGLCIPVEDCYVCGENEVYSDCSSTCFDSCPGPEPTVCAAVCTVGCSCVENYKRDPETNECIPIEDCHDCGENEVYSDCTNSCFERCPGAVALPCPFICGTGCACKQDFRRDPETNECIPIEECQVDCPENSTFDCICDDSCQKDQIQCVQCQYSCACDDGFSRINGTCQPDSLCPTPINDPTCPCA